MNGRDFILIILVIGLGMVVNDRFFNARVEASYDSSLKKCVVNNPIGVCDIEKIKSLIISNTQNAKIFSSDGELIDSTLRIIEPNLKGLNIYQVEVWRNWRAEIYQSTKSKEESEQFSKIIMIIIADIFVVVLLFLLIPIIWRFILNRI